MAIFTDFANYLKCRSYFEDTLGFHTLIIDNVNAGSLNPNNPNEEYVSQDDYEAYGLFASMHNFKIAQNIWFLYGKSLPWSTYTSIDDNDNTIIFDDDNPPREIEKGFELTSDYESGTTDKCGFLLDPTGSTENLEFIGMKRLVPLPLDDNGEYDESKVDELRENYRTIIQFRKLQENGKVYSLSSYSEIEPTVTDLNLKKPNSLKITTSYDYDDFGKLLNKEYNVRQIGMLNLLHAPIASKNLIEKRTTLYNGINNGTTDVNLCDILDITSLSINDENIGDLNIHPVAPSGYDSTDYSDSRNYLGILHFYLNSIPNNRITYQTDYYNFILTFENKVKCSCTCDNCICNQ